jgi:hypothetical protein
MVAVHSGEHVLGTPVQLVFPAASNAHKLLPPEVYTTPLATAGAFVDAPVAVKSNLRVETFEVEMALSVSLSPLCEATRRNWDQSQDANPKTETTATEAKTNRRFDERPPVPSGRTNRARRRFNASKRR